MDERALVAAVQRQLTANYSWLTPERVSDAVQAAYERFAECRVREFVPLLVERRARAELDGVRGADAMDLRLLLRDGV
ncbi:Uncharacterised protein [Mycobacteroides abscessus subsp. massiliense]|uniref:Uncharacterized protein n=1 Tax=Mycobacteroides saopaulense TaxID=1578165 RepID=A0A1X0IKI9_9MYCO|nr:MULTISPECIES: hypothetical protein [Mycobacteroides]AMU77301.1 hypothetical protein A3O06_24075 [Mycobacteroides abscessus]ANO26246.1 hypothetical protein BAB79_24070 [Mycobacteroides abscessus]MBN7316784.1 hypothetical protein [Mycobacteroides abscessus subsp. massiliense]MBN7320200.1 hypothetical protein [Mycobacteroides abscessus subsp. massiliense]ORB48442.1 hypothetical protein BST43_24795 [Mycobacteroides saopaulense]